MHEKIKDAITSIQGTAIFLVIFGTVAVYVGCRWNWAELKTLGAGIAGGGLNAITNQIKNSIQNKEGGVVNIPSSPSDNNVTQTT